MGHFPRLKKQYRYGKHENIGGARTYFYIFRTVAKSLVLDVITFETSIASNYFTKLYNRQFVNLVPSRKL